MNFEKHGILQVRTNPNAKWKSCRDDTPRTWLILGYNGEPIPDFLKEYVRIYGGDQDDRVPNGS